MTYFGIVGTALVAATLATAGMWHLANLSDFRIALRAHELFPARLGSFIAYLVTMSELCIAVGLVGGLATDAYPEVHRFAGGAAILLIGAFSVYLLLLKRGRPGVPCACGVGSAVPPSSWHLARNGLLLAAASASVIHGDVTFAQASTREQLMLAFSVITFGMTMHLLPQSMTVEVAEFASIGGMPERYVER